MAGKLDLNKEISLGGQSRGKRPTKTSINLVIKKERKISLFMLIGIIVLTLLLIILLVVRPVVRLTAANARVSQLQSQVDEAAKTIESYGDVEKEYAHYTTAGMTQEELNRADRVKVMKLVEDAVVNSGAVKKWSLEENIITLDVKGSSLAELNQIASALENESLVERCVINNANRGGGDTGGPVEVTFTVYLKSGESAQVDATDAGNSGEEVQDQ